MKKIGLEKLKKNLEKSKKYKYKKCRRKFQRKVFGIADYDIVTVNGLIDIIIKIVEANNEE